MSALTDRVYREWLARNRGGMGAVAPMQSRGKSPARPASRVRPASPVREPAARPEKLSSFISK